MHLRRSSVISARTAVAALLCTVLTGQPVWAAAFTAGDPPATPSTSTELQGQPRIVHALNRLTFGPRPGEVAEVGRIGLERWFEQQLNPGSIDDSALDARLAQFPAMQMSIAELQQRYPGPAEIRQMENGRLPLPSDPTERALAQTQIAFYQMKKAQQEAKAPAAQSADVQIPNGEAAPATPANPDSPTDVPARHKRQVAAGMNALDGSAASTPAGGTLMSDGTMAPDSQDKALPAAEVNPIDTPAGAQSGAAYPRDRVQAILAQPPEQRMQTVLAMPAPELVRFRQSLKPRDLAQLTDGLNPRQRELLIALPGSLRMIGAEDMESRMLRDVYSNRELEAVMTDFWLNHFNVYLRKNQQEPFLIPTYERETIRPHALGKFEDLLVATAQSPAMLVYLDNFRSTGPDSRAAGRVKQVQALRPNGKLAKQQSAGLNENYGRELMELHTLGVNGGYTQADVTDVAKVFTGWGIDRPYQGGSFQFNENRHEPGSKLVLGKTIHEGGEKEGLEVLHMLATSPATAHFLSEKLAVRFVSDTPPPALVDRMAASFLASGGDIKTVLRTMFHSPEFWSTDVQNAKVKTPEEFVLSATRASGLEVKDGLSLVQALDKLGQPLYGMQTPNGYSWARDGWVSTGALVSRMNFSLVMTGDRLPGTRTEWTTLLNEPAAGVQNASYAPGSQAPETAAEKERRLESLLLGAPVSERTRQTVLKEAGDENIAEQAATEFDLNGAGAGKNGKKGAYGKATAAMEGGFLGGPDDPQAAVIAGLLLGSPEFQRR